MIDVVIPSVRADLVARLLDALDAAPLGGDVVVVWDGAAGAAPALGPGVRVLAGPRRGPAAARNAGGRACPAPWVACVVDYVVRQPGWTGGLLGDVACAGADVAGIQGRVVVPLPAGRPPTDWERNVARLADTPGVITADLVCRRAAVEQVGGFDERFPRAYREDTDFELRVQDAGWRFARSSRRTIAHPVRAAPALVSLSLQRGNADDVLFWALHGARSGVTWGTKARYAATTAAALSGRRVGGVLWAAATAEFLWRRARGGPRTPCELATLALTSALIPPAAVWHTAAGLVRHRTSVRRRLIGARDGEPLRSGHHASGRHQDHPRTAPLHGLP